MGACRTGIVFDCINRKVLYCRNVNFDDQEVESHPMKRRNLNGNHWSDMYICVHPVMAAPLNNEGEKNTSDNRSIVHESFPKRYLIEKDQ